MTNASEPTTAPKTYVLLDPTAPNGETALSRLDSTDNHVALVVGLAGPSAQALRDYAAAEEIDLVSAADIYLDQVADRIKTDNRLVEVVTVVNPSIQAEIAHLTAMNPTRRVLSPERPETMTRKRETTLLRKYAIPTEVRQSRLAQTLPKAELRRLNRLGKICDVPRGHELISESTDAQECYVIIDGHYTVTSPTVQTRIGPGDVIGELAPLTGERRTASVTASSDSTVYELSPADLESLLDDAAQFRSLVLSSATDRLGPDKTALPAKYANHNDPRWSQHLAKVPAWKPID